MKSIHALMIMIMSCSAILDGYEVKGSMVLLVPRDGTRNDAEMTSGRAYQPFSIYCEPTQCVCGIEITKGGEFKHSASLIGQHIDCSSHDIAHVDTRGYCHVEIPPIGLPFLLSFGDISSVGTPGSEIICRTRDPPASVIHPKLLGPIVSIGPSWVFSIPTSKVYQKQLFGLALGPVTNLGAYCYAVDCSCHIVIPGGKTEDPDWYHLPCMTSSLPPDQERSHCRLEMDPRKIAFLRPEGSPTKRDFILYPSRDCQSNEM